MKIHFTMSGLRRGGAERQAVMLAKGLQIKGHDVSFSVAYGGDHFEKQILDEGIPVFHLHPGARLESSALPKKLWHTIRRFTNLVRLVKRGQYDIVQSYGRTAGVYAWPLKYITQSKTVFGVRGSARVANPIFKILQSCAANAAACVISNSDAGRKVVVDEGVDANRVIVIENGIDTSRFNIDVSVRDRVRHELGIAREEVLVGIVGRLHSVKNHELFLDAASRLSTEHQRYRFIIVGHDEPPRLAKLREYSRQLGVQERVIWAGARDDVERIYNAMDVSVLCSRTEGFPNVVAEAMASGIPCVVTPAGDAPRIVGTLGRIVSHDSPNELASAISSIADGYNSIDRQALRARITENWSIEQLVIRTESAYRQILS